MSTGSQLEPIATTMAVHEDADRLARVKAQLGLLQDSFVELRREGFDYQAVVRAIAFGPALKRAPHGSTEWRLRPNSNMALIAEQLEEAGADGLTEADIVNALRVVGRLGSAADARRAVHWSVTELARRTCAVVRASSKHGGRWYALGTFDAWRGLDSGSSAAM